MTKIKICGITNLEDARMAMRFGAHALGFNFYDKSPRYITAAAAGDIAQQLEGSIIKVGVFVDHSIDEILSAIDDARLDAVQLHGDESPQFISELRSRTDRDIIKAFRVSAEFDPNDTVGYNTNGVLLDGYSKNARGGTGETFDWEVAKLVSGLVPALWLAGGLTPENVRGAIVEVGPFAVDACSSLESAPGVKDAAKLERFITEAKGE